MHGTLGWIRAALHEWDARGLRRQLRVRETPQDATLRSENQTLLNFTANDYLGLARECLTPAVIEAIERSGWGAGASPLITGRGRGHAELERALAEFEGTEAALLFTSGYAANMGTITSLVGKGDAVFSDAQNHASIIDGCRLSGAQTLVYPHGDTESLARLLAGSAGTGRKLIVTDGLFSMDGDLAPLPRLVDLADQHEAMLMVDEAHATGVFGSGGRGTCEHFGVEHRVPIRVGTLSKALGSIGGFVVGPQLLIDWLSNRARTFIFSTAMPEASAAAGLSALEWVRSQPHRRIELLRRAAKLRQTLTGQGWDVRPSQSQIIPVRVGEPEAALQLSDQLREREMLVPAIRPPSVPEGQSLLRLSLSYAHTETMIEQLVDALAELRRDGS